MNDLICRLRHLIQTDLVRVTFLNSLSALIRMFSSVISIKVLATLIGPAGIALIGQLSNFTIIIQGLSGGGIASGLTKYIAELSGDKVKTEPYIASAFAIGILLSLAFSVILFLGATFFSGLILHNESYSWIFHVFSFTLVFFVFNNLMLAILNGLKAYTVYIKISISVSLINLVISVLLSVYLGINGSLLSIFILQFIIFIITSYLSIDIWQVAIRYRQWVLHKNVTKQLFQYAAMAIITAILTPLSQLMVRSFLLNKLSMNDAGIWEAVNRISSMYLQVVITSLGIYYLPRLSELKDDKSIRNEVLLVFQVIIPILVLLSFSIYAFRDLLITLIFTPAFQPMRILIPYQLVGDILKMSSWILGYIMVAKAMTRTYIITEIIGFLLNLSLTFFLVYYYELKGAVMAYISANLIYLLLMVWIFRRLLWSRSNL